MKIPWLAPIVITGLAVATWLFLGGRRGLLVYRQATASKPRRFVFSVIVLWELWDAYIAFREWRTLPLSIKIYASLGSLFLSLLWLALIAMIWDSLARRFRPHR